MSIARESSEDLFKGLLPGLWKIDPSHSMVSFWVRHMMISRIRGSFSRFSGHLVTAPDPSGWTATVEVDVASVATMNADRDAHLRGADFFEADQYPTATFESRQVAVTDGKIVLTGDLTIRGVKASTEFHVEYLGAGNDPWGGYRVAFSATTQLSRKAFGMDKVTPLAAGGVLVGDLITLEIEVQAVRDADEAAGPDA